MRLAALAAIAVLAHAGSSAADDSWMGWQTPPDGEANGIDVSFRPLASAICGKPKPFVAIFPRFRSRYTERVSGTLEVVHDDTRGTKTDSTPFVLAPTETMAMTAAPLCVDTSKPIKFAIVGLRFPDRDAEQKKLADAKAAADRVAAEKAAQQKAAAEKAAAEQAAAEEARKKQLAASQKQAEDFTHKRDEHQERSSREEVEKRERERVAALESEQAAHEAVEAVRKAQVGDLRRGEVSFTLPTGYQRVDYPTVEDGGLTIGVRAELRLFAWWAVRGERGNPLGTGVEFALAGGYSSVTNALQSRAADVDTSITTGFTRARVWRSPLALGIAGEWTRYAHSEGGGMTERSSLYAVAPEVAFGFAASRFVAVELGARAGAVANGSGDFKLGAPSDLYVAAYGLVELNYIYAGATATRYTLSGADVPMAWSAVGVLGGRIPF